VSKRKTSKNYPPFL